MFIKRTLVVLLALCFLNFANFVVAPDFAFAQSDETQAEKDARQWRTFVAVAGIALLVYIWATVGDRTGAENSSEKPKYAINSNRVKMGKQAAVQQESKRDDHGIKVALDFSSSGYSPAIQKEPFSESKDEWRSPELKMGYTW